jgi:hypothetical protein
MTDKHTLIAFVAVLISIVLLVAIGAGLVAMGRTVEALGVGAAVSGLIGVLGTFRPAKADPTHPGAPPAA